MYAAWAGSAPCMDAVVAAAAATAAAAAAAEEGEEEEDGEEQEGDERGDFWAFGADVCCFLIAASMMGRDSARMHQYEPLPPPSGSFLTCFTKCLFKLRLCRTEFFQPVPACGELKYGKARFIQS